MELCRCFHELGPKANSFNCKNCGVYMFRHRSVQGVKTQRFADSNLMAPQQFLGFLKKQSEKFQLLPQVRISGETRSILQRLIQKVGIKDDTFALGLYIFYTVFMREVQCTAQQTKLATLSLYQACKTQQSHKGISLRRFWKYSNNSFEKEEYPQIQSFILTQMDFDFEVITFMSFIHFYLVNGVVFTNEPNISAKKVEDHILRLCHWFISTGIFMLLHPEQLACFILYRSREDEDVVEIWNWHIQEYTGVSVKKVNAFVKQIQSMMVQSNPNQMEELSQIISTLNV